MIYVSYLNIEFCCSKFCGIIYPVTFLLREYTLALAKARLALVSASRHTIANALSVLGVAAPESM